MKLALLAVAAASLASAAAPKCAGRGETPRLNGDLFSPVECSTAPAKSNFRAPAPPPTGQAKVDFAALAGRWTGFMLSGFGRYDLAFDLKPARGGAKIAMTLREVQFESVSKLALTLTQDGPPGAFAASLSSDSLPVRALKGRGTVVLGPEPGESAVVVSFENGASYEVSFATAPAGAVRASVDWIVPGAPNRRADTTLTRVPAKN